jgi:hypothetical protein
MQDLTPIVADNEKAVQHTERERWDGEEVHRSNGLAMVSEERQPSFHRIWISRSLAGSIARHSFPRPRNPASEVRRECAALPRSEFT